MQFSQSQKKQETNNNTNSISNVQGSKKFDLEERTRNFSVSVIAYCTLLRASIAHTEITKQMIRSAGSVGANYIEANESLGRKDFLMKIKICLKEAKETRYWLSLTEPFRENVDKQRRLIGEATELIKIFSSIIRNFK